MERIFETTESKIEFNKQLFEEIFIKSPIKLDKDFSSTSLRLMALLLLELSPHEGKKLSPRINMARKLGVSPTAINNSLKELEDAGFIDRITSELEKMVPVEEREKEHQEYLEYTEKVKEENKKANNFSDYFTLNLNFNKTEEEIRNYNIKVIKTSLASKISDEKLEEIFNIIERQHKIR